MPRSQFETHSTTPPPLPIFALFCWGFGVRTGSAANLFANFKKLIGFIRTVCKTLTSVLQDCPAESVPCQDTQVSPGCNCPCHDTQVSCKVSRTLASVPASKCPASVLALKSPVPQAFLQGRTLRGGRTLHKCPDKCPFRFAVWPVCLV